MNRFSPSIIPELCWEKCDSWFPFQYVLVICCVRRFFFLFLQNKELFDVLGSVVCDGVFLRSQIYLIQNTIISMKISYYKK